MTVTCDNCSTLLQIDESKASSERFAVRCSKCQQTIEVQLKNNSGGAASARSWENAPAMTYQKRSAKEASAADVDNNVDLLQLLTAALQQNTLQVNHSGSRRQQQFKRVLVCLSAERSEMAAQILDENGYTVFIAENPAQATEKIHDEEVDIIVYSADFAVKFGGSGVIQQTIRTLVPLQRRRFFVVSLEDNLPTFNTHEAFLRNLNLIVNSSDLHHLPSILSRALRDFEELYKNFNQALQTS